MSEQTIHDMMFAYSEDAISLARQFNISLDYSEESLKQVEGILKKYHQGIPRGVKRLFTKGPTDEQISQLCMIWGGYLGEVMRRHCGGEWGISKSFEDTVALINKSNESYPPSKIHKRITNGPEDDICFYYEVFKNRINL